MAKDVMDLVSPIQFFYLRNLRELETRDVLRSFPGLTSQDREKDDL